jgi:hypothetical protein
MIPFLIGLAGAFPVGVVLGGRLARRWRAVEAVLPQWPAESDGLTRDGELHIDIDPECRPTPGEFVTEVRRHVARNWTAGMALVALSAAVVTAGALWLSWDRWPAGTAQGAAWACLTIACVWRANRNLRAELEACRERLAAWNGSESRDDLAAVGPISPASGVPTIHVSGGAVAAAVLSGVLGKADRPVELYDQDAEPLPNPMSSGLYPIDHDRMRRALDSLPDGTVEVNDTVRGLALHLGQPCADCGAPATSWVSDPGGALVPGDLTFLCDDHYAAAMAAEEAAERAEAERADIMAQALERAAEHEDGA